MARLRIAAAVTLILGMLVAGSPPAGAVDLTVTTADDVLAGDGFTSLREAFLTASANASDDTIVLDGGTTYVLNDCVEGELVYSGSGDLVVQGNGATIQQTCPGESIIRKDDPNDNVLTLENLTLVVGPTGGGNVFGHAVEATSQLVLDGVTIENGDAGFGGTMVQIDFGPAIHNLIIRNSSISNNTGSATGNLNPSGVLVENSTINNNTGSGISISDGSPIDVSGSTIDDNGGVGIVTSGQGFGLQPAVTITNSSVSGNTNGGFFCLSSCRSLTVSNSQIDDNGSDAPTPGRGGGITVPIVLQGGDLPSVTITDSSVSGNRADHDGAGVLVFPSFESDGPDQPAITVVNSSIENNRTLCAGCDGGGVSVSVGSLTVTDSSITGNEATGNGGGIAVTRSPTADVAADATLGVVRSTISQNSADANGGGLWIDVDTADIKNSTIDDNTGAGIVANAATSVDHSTITRNDPVNVDGPVSLRRSILADAVIANCGGVGQTSAGGNWLDDGSCTTGVNDIVDPGADPGLSALTDNGGPTLTRLPESGSAVAGALPSVQCGGSPDQRGEPRPAGFGCEPGAVEITDPLPPLPPGFPASVLPSGDLRLNGTSAPEEFEVVDRGDFVEITYTRSGDPAIVGYLPGPFRDVRADLRGSDDVLELVGVRANRDFRLDGDAGDDSITVSDVEVGRELIGVGGSGDDALSIVTAQVTGRLRLSGGNGDDTLDVFTSNAGSLNANGGFGNDAFQFSAGVVAGSSVVFMGSGDDGILLAEVVFARTTVRGGSGNDQLSTFVSSFSDRFSFTGDGGDDTVSLSDTQFDGRSFFNGGGGTDAYGADPATSFSVPPVIISF